MRVIPFPSKEAPIDPQVLAELEAAFDGDGTGPEAEAWRELRADVRALAPPIDSDFERRLEQQLRGREQRPARGPRRLRAQLRSGDLRWRPALAAAAALLVVAGLVVTATETPSSSVGGPAGSHTAVKGVESAPAQATSSGAATARVHRHATKGFAELAPAAGGEAPGQTQRRLQQLGASITLGARSEGVQALADRVGRLAVGMGGFVESSKVELQRGSAGEATLTLKLPSAKLEAMLAKLQRLAPVRAETQSLQDLTGHYDAVGARLGAARAERTALLRALAKAQTAAAVESLHQRIAQADGQIASQERERASISHSASQAGVEVSVVGEGTHAGAGGGLTLGRGLHDAGRVLVVSLAVLLIALAVLIPLALLLGVLLLGARGWRRQQRERALGPS